MSQNWGKITVAACSEQNVSFFGPPKKLIQFYLRKQRAFCACQGVKNTVNTTFLKVDEFIKSQRLHVQFPTRQDVGSMDGAFKQSIGWASTAAASNSMCVGCVLLYIYIYPPINWHRPCQIGVGRLVSTKKLLCFRVQLLISQRVRVYVIPYPSPTIWLASSPASFACFSASKATCSTRSACKCRTFEPFQCV